MPIAAFFVVFAGALAIAILYPHLRAIAVIVGLICGGIMGYIAIDLATNDGQRGPQIPLDALEVTFQTETDARFVRVSGRAFNGAPEHRLREFTIDAILHDCPAEDSPLDDCAVIDEREVIVRADIPAGQTRNFQAVVGFLNQVEAEGFATWEYRLAETRATD